jgi:DNA-binding CsgD family transcriptional regulator
MKPQRHNPPRHVESMIPHLPFAPSSVGALDPRSDALDFGVLFAAAESVLGVHDGAGEHLCEEVEILTRRRAMLRLHPHARIGRLCGGMPAGARQLPVEFDARLYGTLLVHPDPSTPSIPALPDAVSRQLARVCGGILHMLDQAALLAVLCQRLVLEVPDPLTQRQQEVLALLAYGLSDDEIVGALHISPETLRRHRYDMYGRLRVHNAHDLLLIAYQRGMVTYLVSRAKPSAALGRSTKSLRA